MKTGRIVSIFALVCVVAATALLLHPLGPLGNKIWPPSDICPLPTPEQFPFFVVIAVIEAGALGLGVAFMTCGYGAVKWLRHRWQRLVVFIGLGWHMMNWALHDGFHQVAGIDLTRILYIEYGFHVTLIVASCLIVLALIEQARHMRRLS